jgi:hypothetical protein
MPRVARPRTPAPVKAALVVVPLALATWLLVSHLDRVHLQQRLGLVASQIAGRPVRVHCPGVIGHALSWDTVEGTVQFDPGGRPADVTDLRAPVCDELDALTEGDRAGVLACLRATPEDCGAPAVALAEAVDTVTHESFHLSGIMDEAVTECHSLGEMARTAQRLGATAAEGAALADVARREIYPYLPSRYQMTCPAAAPGYESHPSD